MRKRKYQAIYDYYDFVYDILKEHLPYKPELKLVYAKTYYGALNGIPEFKYYESINISVVNLWSEVMNSAYIEELIYTICHEFAHMKYWNHTQDHSDLTEFYYVIVKMYHKGLQKIS